jgi:AraC-like DNA-binding protein
MNTLHQIIKPAGVLSHFISDYHIIETDCPIDFLPKHRIYTYGSIVLVFHYNNPSLFQKRNEQPYIEPKTVICGQQTQYYDLALAGKTGMILVIFRPFGAGMFFKMPMSEIKNDNIALEYIIKSEALEIEDKLRTAKSKHLRTTLIEDFLRKRVTHSHTNCHRMSTVFEALYKYSGQISIGRLAEISCLSVKQFERKFSELVGLNPKQYLRIARFQDVLQKKKSICYLNYTSLACACGYYDQSHFIHDFKSVTDLSPKEFFAAQNIG